MVADWIFDTASLVAKYRTVVLLWFSVPIFGVRVSVMSHLMCVHIISSSVWVTEWPPFGKELLTRLTICSLCILTNCNFSYFPFWFWVLDLGSDCFGIGFSQCLNVASHGRKPW